MKRRALITREAQGNTEEVDAALIRFGFGEVVYVKDRDHALLRLHEESFDLAVISLEDLTPAGLVSLEREIRRNPHISVIGTAATTDSELILRALRAGCHEFLVAPISSEALAGAVERLMWRSSKESAKGEVIAVYSGKGGLGVTSLAVNLAQALAGVRQETRVAIADLVVTGGDVRIYLNLNRAYDLGDLVEKGDKVDADLLNSLLTACPGGVWALPTGDNPELEESFDAGAIKSIIDVLRAHFGVTVLDCEHSLTGRTLAALDAADKILLVTQLSVPAMRSTQRTLSICRRLGYDIEKLMVIVNRHLSADVLSLKEAADLLQCPISFTIPNDHPSAAACLNKGVPVVLNDPHSRMARTYFDIARRLTGLPELHGAKDAPGVSRFGKILGFNKRVGNVT